MKPARLTPAARQDRRDEVTYYRAEAGARVAQRLVDALQKAQQDVERQPSIGSPPLGIELEIEGMRTWRLDGFPLSLWYFERADHVLIVRVIGQRREAESISVVSD